MGADEAPQLFEVMIKPRGAVCNLACTYCYYLQKDRLYRDSTFRMSDELLEEFTRQYVLAQEAPEVTFAWHGGEPTLMGLEFFERAVYYQRKCAPPGMRIQNSLQTNGVGLNSNWAQFFAANGFLIGISLDGPRELHDAYRVDKGGRPTFDRVMEGLSLLKEHQVAFNVITAVHRTNEGHPLEVYRFFRDDLQAEFIQFIPIVERVSPGEHQGGRHVTRETVHAARFGEFLIGVFDEWVRRDIGRVYIQIFDVALGAWLGQHNGICVHAPICGTSLALEHNGDLFACDHFVDHDHLLGNILQDPMVTLVRSEKQRAFAQRKWTTLPRCCRECEVLFACHGGCPKNRIDSSPDGDSGLNYLCGGYKAFFTHVGPAMQFMANELRNRRAPANVMRWIKDSDARGFPANPSLDG